MTATVWLHDSAGAWLDDVRAEDGAPGIIAPAGARVRIEGDIEIGESLTVVRPTCWTVLEDSTVEGSQRKDIWQKVD